MNRTQQGARKQRKLCQLATRPLSISSHRTAQAAARQAHSHSVAICRPPGPGQRGASRGPCGTGFTPPGHMRLSPAGTVALRLPMCILACKASVYKSGSKKDRNPNNSRFTEADLGLPFLFFLVRRQREEMWSST
ncbi:unnamed protein product [Rangifer tarandus platyrhynchus]|uniref:Uncharacterized protein n=1 Tax=Rangifer tarandus platyrhynchus TaxID=3082113 RepID=A0AC59YBB6_RANTA